MPTTCLKSSAVEISVASIVLCEGPSWWSSTMFVLCPLCEGLLEVLGGWHLPLCDLSRASSSADDWLEASAIHADDAARTGCRTNQKPLPVEKTSIRGTSPTFHLQVQPKANKLRSGPGSEPCRWRNPTKGHAPVFTQHPSCRLFLLSQT